MNTQSEQCWEMFRSADKTLEQASKSLDLALNDYVAARDDLICCPLSDAELQLVSKMIDSLEWQYNNRLQNHVFLLNVS